MSNTLVFNPFDPVTGRPTVDGLVLADIGVTTPEAEPGYVNGARVEIGSSGLSPVVINAVQDGDTLVIGVLCRSDSSFDSVDMVMLAFRNAAGQQRRIDIRPNWGDEPDPMTVAAVAETGYGAANPDPANPGTRLTEAPSPLGFDIRTNKPAHIGPTFYERSGPSGNWSNASAPIGFECKVRSWRPNVTADSPTEIAWSLEVRVPVGVASGGAGWIDLGDDFGLFIDVFRAFRYLDAGDPLFGWRQYIFPATAPELTGVINHTTDIPAASFGRGLRGAMVSQGQGVRIKGGSMGIGCRQAGSAVLQNRISATVDNTIVAQLENTGPLASGVTAEVRMANWGLGPPQFNAWTLAAGCTNPSPAVTVAAGTPGTPGAMVETLNAWPAGSVPADYQNSPHQCMWVQLKGAGVVFTQSSARRNMDFVDFSSEERPADISAVGYPKPGDGSDTQEFLLRTRCRKIVVSELIGAKDHGEETVTIIGGALQHALENDKLRRDQIDAPRTHVAVASSGRRGADMYMDSVVYLWITEGLRRTHKVMELDGVKGEIWDPSPGDFSLAAYHNGVDDPMGWQMSGGGLIQRGKGVYGIKVKDGKTATINVKVGAGPEIRPGDTSDLPRGFDGNGGGNTDGPPKDPKDGNGGGGPKLPGGCGKQLILLALVPAALYAVGQLIA